MRYHTFFTKSKEIDLGKTTAPAALLSDKALPLLFSHVANGRAIHSIQIANVVKTLVVLILHPFQRGCLQSKTSTVYDKVVYRKTISVHLYRPS